MVPGGNITIAGDICTTSGKVGEHALRTEEFFFVDHNRMSSSDETRITLYAKGEEYKVYGEPWQLVRARDGNRRQLMEGNFDMDKTGSVIQL